MSPQKNATTLIEKMLQSIFVLVLFFSPLIVLPFTEQFIIQSKTALLVGATILVLALYVVQLFYKKVVHLTISPLTIPLLAFGLAITAATFFSGNYPVEHLIGMGGVYISFVLFILFAGMFGKKIASSTIVNALLGTNVAIFVASLLQMTGYGPARLFNSILPLPLPTDSLIFNVTGSSLVAAEIAFITLIGSLLLYIVLKKQPNIFQLVGIGITVLSFLLHAYTVLPGKQAAAVLLPLATNWSIAVDTLRTPKTALIGFGPQSFSNAYSIYKPAWVNGTEYWAISFNQGSNIFLTLLVTTGLIGVGTFLLLFLALFRQRNTQSKQAQVIFGLIFTTLAIMLVLPPNIVLISFLAVFIATWIVLEKNRFTELELHTFSVIHRENQIAEQSQNRSTFFVILIALVVGMCIVLASYGFARAYMAEATLLNSTKAAQRNELVKAYTLQQQAISLNPYIDSYRRRFSATSLTIAAALAEKENPSEEDQAQFSQLVQQSISEGRAAVALDELDFNNWLHLAEVYRNLIGVAEDANQWAVTTYLNAIQLNPTNPELRIELGGILFASENYTDAITFFQQAINLKPDLANAYYNLANAYLKNEQYSEAVAAYQQTLLLVEPDSEDYLKATEELTQAQELADGTKTNQPSQVPAETQNTGGLESLTEPGVSALPSINTQNLTPPSETIQNSNTESTQTQGDTLFNQQDVDLE